jgi:putative hemolysin
MMEHGTSFLLILVFLLLEGLFSGGEIALIASDIHKIRQKALAGSRSASIALKLLDRPEWFLATTLTGTDLCIIVNTSIATSVFISLFGAGAGGFYAIAVMIPLVIVAAEIIPKSLFQQRPEAVALRLAGFIRAASWILYPLVFVVAWIARGSVYLLTGGAAGSHSPYITKQGLKFLIREKTGKGDLLRVEKEMIRRVFDFSEARVEQIMVPLSHVAVLEESATLGEAVALIREKGFSRVPVFRESVFQITGILHSFDLLRAQSEGHQETIKPYVRSDVYYVPDTKSASELLLELQRRGDLMAVVVDEYGGAVGIVTMEDLLEEVVGEIEDEYDRGEKPYLKMGPGRYLFNARTNLERIRELIHLEIPEGDYETVGGFILNRLGRIPKRRESIRDGDVLFIIEDADPRSIKEVLIVMPDKEEFRV